MVSNSDWYGPLARYVKLRVRMRRECRERFPRHRRWAIPTYITARASRTCRDACRDRQLAVSFEIGGGGKRSRHSRRMRNLQFYVSGKRPMRPYHEANVRDLHYHGHFSDVYMQTSIKHEISRLSNHMLYLGHSAWRVDGFHFNVSQNAYNHGICSFNCRYDLNERCLLIKLI